MLSLLARAKINWTLDILEKLPNGYHRMDMLISGVELADRLTLEEAQSLSLTVSGNPQLSQTDNLVLKAADVLQKAAGIHSGASCVLQKLVPTGAGMGGGSADAAAALVGLNQLWHIGFTKEQLIRLGAEVGADVPFLVAGGFARVGGMGEVVQSLTPLPVIPLVVVQPCGGLATREAFAAFDTLRDVAHPDTEESLSSLSRGDFTRFAACAGNVLQPSSENLRPPIREAVMALFSCGVLYAAMTGSGSAVFGAFANDTEADQAYYLLCRRWQKCWRTRTSMDGITFSD